eukprot:CAMPEP_0184680852 /NCGR_PEP_ID=MMETSP0312-20130426/3770_1 /TAXON_ID=31354 /ORGANISM="Compsopogon coeruleus, Strain SAG 36.94" /LENGTH=361 /DNA_ID=CAMNT_0027131251 /DNA_START=240 /DNA_END=1325 /DNA_ORIENTATION=-
MAAGRGPRRHGSTVAMAMGMGFLDPQSGAAAAASTAAWLFAAAAAPDGGNPASDAAVAAATAATTVTAQDPGLFDRFTKVIESLVISLHDVLAHSGVPYSYGFAIILFTVGVKALTYPLNFQQMSSTMKMQGLQPKVKKIQSDFRDNPQVMNQMIATLYREEQVNPLAGCLPVFVQIPVWIALYRALLNMAKEDLLKESFFFLPSLQGPVSTTGGSISDWLFPLVDGAPPVGWHDAICYLVLPVVLVITQLYSQRVLTPPNNDPQQQQANAILKFLPFLLGWFSLNVPSGLGVYWVTNNLLTTAQTLFIRSQFKSDDDSSDGGPSLEQTSPEQFRVIEKPDGFSTDSRRAKKGPSGKKKRK